jgi:GNAT superfamily N-acetyltransferase
VVDEFTSTVDRVVARAVAVAVARAARQRRLPFVAVTCHRDVLPWLTPDWVLDMDQRRFLHPGPRHRPPILLRVYPGSLAAWPLFARHHYLTAAISPRCTVFLGTVAFGDDPDAEERLAAFFAILPAAGKRGWWRGHRTVVLPDFQGLGIGNTLIERVAEWLWRTRRERFRATTAAPAIVAHRRRHPERWRLVHAPSQWGPSASGRMTITSAGRLTTSWEYIPEDLRSRAPSPAPAEPRWIDHPELPPEVGRQILRSRGTPALHDPGPATPQAEVGV